MLKFNKKKIFLWSSFVFVFLIVGAIIFNLFVFNYAGFWRAKSVIATGGYPFEIGLSASTALQCQLSCYVAAVATCCTMGTLCTTKDVATCVSYSDVSGSPSGGMGSNALFLTSNLSAAGATGGQLIAGGMSMTQMDNGVIAGVGGCVGGACVYEINEDDGGFTRVAKKFANFMIAGIK